MRLKEAVDKIQSGDVLPCTVVLHGDEEYIRATGVRELTRAAHVQAPEMNVTTFEGRPPMDQLLESLARFPFMSETKVVVLRDTDILSTLGPIGQAKLLENALIEDHTLFIITASGKLDRRRSYVKHLMKSALLVDCAPLTGDALARFVDIEARRRRLHIAKGAATMLADRMQGDLYAITNELDKLSSILTGQITARDIEMYTPQSAELNMFRIFDTFANGKREQGHAELRRLLADDPTPIGFVTFLANTFRQMLVARACRDAKFPERRTIECVCEETGVREWSARRAYERCVRFSAAKLRENVRLLAKVDFGAKQGEYVLHSDLYGLVEMLFADSKKTGARPV